MDTFITVWAITTHENSCRSPAVTCSGEGGGNSKKNRIRKLSKTHEIPRYL
jgi:hypothetical protein